MGKLLALNINGDITYCTVDPENRGKGRCNHIAHQNPGESSSDFIKRIEDLKKHREEVNSDPEQAFIPYNGTTIKTTIYRMSDEEKEDLVKIENRMQLDMNIEGGYIELDEPLWNDMDESYFSQLSGIHKNKIKSILHEESCIVMESDNPKFPVGRVIDTDYVENNKEKLKGIKFGTGVLDMNRFAEENYNWQATKDVFVLPYYMRIGAKKDVQPEYDDNGELIEREEGDDVISSDITIAYKYLLRNHKNPQVQQNAYEALLNNSSMDKDKARYTKGYRNKSLADMFAGKGGVFRACLSGSSIPYSGRTVIVPEVMPYGEIKIPASVAVDIFKPSLIYQLANEGKTIEEMDAYFREFRVEQTQVPKELNDDLERRIQNLRVITNRQPSLHTSSEQSYRPKISGDSATHIHPLYCKAFGADFDGDTETIYGINQDYAINLVDSQLDSKLPINTQIPRSQKSSAILPSKDALFGLLNILEKRTV